MYTHTQKGGAVLWILIIIVLAVGGFFLYRAVKPLYYEPKPLVDRESDVDILTDTTIVYDANGFSPSVVTVKKGDTIVFQNKTGQLVSIASGPHPTHTTYPEFDQYKTDQRGKDEFRFVFEKVGEWKYHDHLNAKMTGTVVVTE